MKYVGRAPMFLDTILAIEPEQVAAGFNIDMHTDIPTRVRGHDEAWLRDILPPVVIDKLRFSSRPEGGRCILERSSFHEKMLWNMLQVLLRTLDLLSKGLMESRPPSRDPRDVALVESRLDQLDDMLDVLDSLVSRSPSFSCVLRNPAVVNTIEASGYAVT
jgi:hypothetical protein